MQSILRSFHYAFYLIVLHMEVPKIILYFSLNLLRKHCMLGYRAVEAIINAYIRVDCL